MNILAEKLNITEQELRELLPSGKKKIFYDRVNWAKTYMKKAGLLEAPKRGTVKITKLGLELKSKDLLKYSSFLI